MTTYDLFPDGYKLPKPLSKSEINELLYKDDSESKSKLIEHNVRLVIHQVMTRFMYPNPLIIEEEKNGRIRI